MTSGCVEIPTSKTVRIVRSKKLRGRDAVSIPSGNAISSGSMIPPSATDAVTEAMGQPVVHFEMIGKDADKRQGHYAELFGWEINADNPMKYGMAVRDGTSRPASTAPSDRGRTDTRATSPSTSRCPTWRPRSRRPRASAGRESWARRRSWTLVELGQFKDPEGHVVGVVESASSQSP